MPCHQKDPRHLRTMQLSISYQWYTCTPASTQRSIWSLMCTALQTLKLKPSPNMAKGVRRKVTNKNTIPIYWHKFLRHNDNKTELYHFLANKVAQMFAPNMVIVTKASAVLSAHGTGLDGLNICSHQEVDSRIFVQAKHATEHGSQSIMIKANDTGVVPSPVSKRLGRCRLHLGKVRAFAGSGVHDTFHYVGQEKVKGMLFFHACTGCDTATRKLLGRHGTYVQRPCLYSPNWVFTLPRWRIPTYTGGFWRSLAS